MMTSSSKNIGLALALVAIVLGVQMSAITRPYTGHFASYQATVMASIARNMERENFKDLLRPKTDIMLTSPERSLHLNQYPFPAVLAAMGVRTFGGSFEFWGRFQAILFNLLTALLLGLLARRLFDSETAWMATVIYLFSPFTLMYGQSFISEPSSLFLFVLSLFLLVRSQGEKTDPLQFAGSAISFSAAVTGRIHLLVFYPLFAVYISMVSRQGRMIKVIGFTMLALLMPMAWYGYTYFASLNQENVHTNIFLQLGLSNQASSAMSLEFLRHLVFIFVRTLLTPVLVVFFFWGFFCLPKEKSVLWLTILGCVLGGLVVFLAPQKVIHHDFYLYGLYPFVVMVTACGVRKVFEKLPWVRKGAFFWAALYLIFSAAAFRNPIFQGLAEEKQGIRVAEKVQSSIEPTARVIVASRHPAVTIYYLNRRVWNMDLGQIGRPIVPYLKNRRFRRFDTEEIERLETAMEDPTRWVEYLHSKGADYLLVPDRRELDSFPEFVSHLRNSYALVSGESDEFYLFHLSK